MRILRFIGRRKLDETGFERSGLLVLFGIGVAPIRTDCPVWRAEWGTITVRIAGSWISPIGLLTLDWAYSEKS